MPRSLIDRVRRDLERRGLVADGDRGLVALSGGPDSLCLLQLMAELAPALRLTLRAAHVDHGLRRESSTEAARALALAAEVGVEAVVLRADLDRRAPGNLEERARDARRALLEAEARAGGCAWIAVGHTASDQAETVLMRLVRGAGLRGLGAMAWRSGRVIRPLLGVSRSEGRRYIADRGLEPVQDPTNLSDAYLRNRLRRRVLPLLARENPRITRSLCRLAETCREEDAALDRLARQGIEDARVGAAEVDCARLRQLSIPLLRRALRLIYAEATGSLRGLGEPHVEALAALATDDAAGTRQLDLPGVRFARSYERLGWRRGTAAAEAEPFEVQVDGPGDVLLPDGRVLRIEAVPPGPGVTLIRRTRFPLTVRAPRSGDRIAIGPGRSKKVSRALLDAKIPRLERRRVLVVLTGSEVALVLGLRRAYGFAPSADEEALAIGLQETRLPSLG
jgi:tRNA(Ile)-lysidine synthase